MELRRKRRQAEYGGALEGRKIKRITLYEVADDEKKEFPEILRFK